MKTVFAPLAISRLAATLAIAGFVLPAQATIILTTNPTDIANFASGATVETFDSIAGVTAFVLIDYNTHDLAGSPAALFNKDAAQPAFYNSGGASFNDPVGNPGTKIAVVAPSGAIAGDKFSGNNVAGPLGVGTTILFNQGSFMEVIFPTAVSKVGVFVAHGPVSMFLKDLNNTNLATGDFSGTASSGQFLGITRASADIRGVTFSAANPFTIDNFTYGLTTTPPTSAPDMGIGLNLAIAALFLGLMKWRLNSKSDSAARGR